MPSKALLRPGELLAESRRVPGVPVGDGLDVAAVLARRDEVIHDGDDSSQLPWLEERGVTLVRGRGRLDGERACEWAVDDVLVAGHAVVVATGSGPVWPPLEGLEEARPWSNREATTASSPPESLVVLGGGVVGVELAQAWSTLGVPVVLLEGAPRILVREEPFASAEVEASLREQGVDVRTGIRAVSVSRSGAVVAGLADGDSARGRSCSSPSAASRRRRSSGWRRSGSSRQAGGGRLEPAFAAARLALRDRGCGTDGPS